MQKILVPTDFSSVADNAVQYAVTLSKKHGGEFIFFHAGPENTGKLQDHIKFATGDLEPDISSAKYISADVDFTVDAVKELIATHKVDMVVMGTHGTHIPFPPRIFGSHTAAIMEEIGVPVIAVPADYIFNSITHIAYATDLVNLKKELASVVRFAKVYNASVNMFHVTPVFPDFYDLDKVDVTEIIETVKAKENFPYITYHIVETEKDNQVVKGINNFIDEHFTDLLVLFHTSRSWIDKIISPSASVKEVSQIRVPVMIFPKEIID
jgi:nucleotide-binding universal stress UspA family protein